MNEQIKQYFKGTALLIPLILIVVLLIYIAKPHDRYADLIARERTTDKHKATDTVAITDSQPIIEFKPFDPNIADFRTMLEAGVPRKIAVSLIKWREAGKRFRIKEDVALCYGMTDSLYFLLEPYIVIGEEYRIKPKSEQHTTKIANEHSDLCDSVAINYTSFSLDTVTAAYLHTIGFSLRQAELIIRYREMIGGYRSIEEFAECYAVSEEMAERLRPYLIFPEKREIAEVKRDTIKFPIEINSADSATLRRVRGIGEKSVVQIIEYRKLLGGYYSTEQISELKVVTEDNFQRILPQIYCDSAKIKKININFAGPKVLEVHPYITNRMLRRIINHRELKGGWSTIGEMIEDDIFSEEEAKRIAPYLHFGTKAE
jgi:DNA uptake protein ComE-like DNA-binding protein